MLTCSGFALADDADDEMPQRPGTRDCVSLAGLDRTRVVNDDTILFYMKGKIVYANTLPRTCRGLKRTDALSYSTSLSRLCNVDIISGLRSSAGSFYPAVRCGLGMFVPIEEDELALLLAEPELKPEPGLADPDIEAPVEDDAD
ncbi:MAG: hypothetical protein ACR2QB_03160 [Gammaproteobacteria bacterium]